jgi:hypothetical protein
MQVGISKSSTSLNSDWHLQDGIWDQPTLITYHSTLITKVYFAQKPMWVGSICIVHKI